MINRKLVPHITDDMMERRLKTDHINNKEWVISINEISWPIKSARL